MLGSGQAELGGNSFSLRVAKVHLPQTPTQRVWIWEWHALQWSEEDMASGQATRRAQGGLGRLQNTERHVSLSCDLRLRTPDN